jgi:ABC-2 type transport system permease protein
MVAISSFIGWAAHTTVTNVYNEVLRQGFSTAPNPFVGSSPLYYLRNTIIYIVLIGALLAIVLGVQSSLRDRKAHTMDLVLSRPVPTWLYLVAKFSGVAIWLLGVLIISAVINWASISGILGHVLSVTDSVRIISFYVLAWLFLLPFIVFGLLGGLYTHREANAFLLPIVIWSLLTFVLPQLGTAERPIALLNPVPAQIASQGFFFQLNRTIFGSLSITEHFKQASAVILRDNQVSGGLGKSIFVITGFGLISLAILLITKRTRLREDLYE